jgi:hypothetical protein
LGIADKLGRHGQIPLGLKQSVSRKVQEMIMGEFFREKYNLKTNIEVYYILFYSLFQMRATGGKFVEKHSKNTKPVLLSDSLLRKIIYS